ncbi:hypothetical protein K438DRAFT_1964915 [Mycena galopus ATCC 62051]|nr:hypothetical protein K438DRAFT_1964915 [Mycena galopus ATCC 62051]
MVEVPLNRHNGWIEDDKRAEHHPRVCTARAATLADPTNITKKLHYQREAGDYAEIYDYDDLDDAKDIKAYVYKKTRADYALDELQCAARPLDAYVAAAKQFAQDFGHPYDGADGLDDVLSDKCKLRCLHKHVLALDDDARTKLIGRRMHIVELRNPFSSRIDRHAAFDLKLREHMALYRGVPVDALEQSIDWLSVIMRLSNRFHADPSSLECQELFCIQELWTVQTKALVNTANNNKKPVLAGITPDVCALMQFTEKELELIRTKALPECIKIPSLVPRPSHLLAKSKARDLPPLVYGVNGLTLSQRLTRPLPKTPRKARPDPPSSSPYVSEYHPSESPEKHGAPSVPLKQNQWQQWTYNILPKLGPVFLVLWSKTQSLRNVEGLALPELKTLAVDVTVLEFVKLLFVNLPPNNTAFCNTLEGFLASRDYKLTTKDTLRIRFTNALESYTTLRNTVGAKIEKLLNAARHIVCGDEIIAEPEPDPTTAGDSTPPSTPVPSTPSTRMPPVTPVRDGPNSSPSPPLRPQHKCRREPQEPQDDDKPAPPNPVPDPPPRTRVSDYLLSRCPACFGGLEHDPSHLVGIDVSLDACFTQKRRRKRGGRDPARMHPDTHFVPEETVKKMDEHVENVRPAKPPKAKQPRAEEVADGYEGDMKVPRSVLNECESSFKAPDEKREAASTQFFDDTGIMALLRCHDRVLWMVNMRTAGEKQYYVLALLETLFQHLPLNIRVGVLYDIACQLHLSCTKFGFLGRYLHRILFGVSVFHAFAHRWACQLIYHPLKCRGFGFTNGEGCERFWHSISKLIAHLRVSGYHSRLHTIGSQVEHADKASLGRLGTWLMRRTVHCQGKLQEALADLATCKVPEATLRKEWEDQVKAQTRPAQRRSKKRGVAAVEEVILLRKHVDALFEKVTMLQDVETAWKDKQAKLRRLEQQLGVSDATALQKLRHSDYYAARMNAKVLKERLWERLREHKFEWDPIEHSLISRPDGAIAPLPIPTKGVFQLDVDDAIWQDIGLDDDTTAAGWLVNKAVRAGIRAMLQKDRCKEEAPRLRREQKHMRIWFTHEWAVVSELIGLTDGALLYQFELKREEILQLCVVWKKSLDALPCDDGLPPWGPTDQEIRGCQISSGTAAYGNGEDSEEEDSDEDGGADDDDEEDADEEDADEEEEDDDLLYVLEAVERADTHRRGEEEEDWASDDEEFFT